MLQKLGKIKVGHFFLRYYNIDPPGLLECTDPHTYHGSLLWVRHWSSSTPHFLVEYVMDIRMILSLLRLVSYSIKYSTCTSYKAQELFETTGPSPIFVQ